MRKVILITGGAGFIGSFLVDELVKQKHTVKILDNLEPQVHISNKIPDYLNPNVEFIRGDIRNSDDLEKCIDGTDVVFHFASMVGVGQSMYEIGKYVDVNITGTGRLMDTIVNSDNHVKKVIVASSMSLYGEGEYYCKKCNTSQNATRSTDQLKKRIWEPVCPKCHETLTAVGVTEEKKPEAANIYAITKKTQEDIVMNVGGAYEIPCVGLRYFNTYGPRQSLNNPYTGVAVIFMSQIKNNQSPLIFEDGQQTRDFVSVHDVTRANLLAMNSSKADYEVFNVGSGQKITILELAEKILKLQNSSIKPHITNKYRKGDCRHCFSDITKIKRKLNFSPRISIEDGLRELIEWSKGQEAIDNVQQAIKILKQKKMMD